MEESTDIEQEEKVRKQYRDLFSTPLGQDVLADMRKEFCRTSFSPTNTHVTAYNEGRRSVVLLIEQLLSEGAVPTQTTAEGMAGSDVPQKENV